MCKRTGSSRLLRHGHSKRADRERTGVGFRECELNQVNPFDYLTELLRHPAEVAVRPAGWMPWNYRPDAAAVAA